MHVNIIEYIWIRHSIQTVYCLTNKLVPPYNYRWNFSVGQHEISYLLGESKHCQNTDDYDVSDDSEETTCWTEEGEELDDDDELPIMKVFMSPGAVVALDRSGSHSIMWKKEVSVVYLEKLHLQPKAYFESHQNTTGLLSQKCNYGKIIW